MVSKNFPLVSIIITTKNEEKNIGGCLESIKRQSYPQDRIEMIVVDNNSTDKTKGIAKKYTNRVYNFPDLEKMKKISNFRGAQLNFGVKKSHGEIIFFPDADMTFDEKLIEESVNFVQKRGFDALYIPEVVLGRGLFGKIRNFERSFYNTSCIDAVRVIKKDMFLKVGGFDEKNIGFGPDDWDFTKKIKEKTQKVTITSNKVYHHEEELSFSKYLAKKQKYTSTFDGYIKKWGKNDPDVQKQLGFWYRYFGVFIESSKWRKLLKHPVLAIGMYFLRFMVGIQYLRRR